MKKISLLSIVIVLMLNLFSCKKDDLDFDNFDYTTIYFPYQYPVRTLVLGDYTIDNTNDNNLKFLISARVGGMYKNHSNWNVTYEVEESLANNLITNANKWDGKEESSSDVLTILPAKYYTLNPSNSFEIRKGEFHGGIEVQLTDDFLDDPNAFTTHYVIPIKITSSTADSVLTGKPNSLSSDPRIASEWTILPKNFTIFGIKFVNTYHGKYLHRGKSVITDGGGNVTQTISYRQRYVEEDELWTLQTSGKNRVSVTGMLRSSPSSPGNFKMDLDFDENGECTITTSEDSMFPVTGNGKFVKDGDMWGNKPRNAIYLDYKVTEGTNTHSILDTLVFRDKAVTFQEYVPAIVP